MRSHWDTNSAKSSKLKLGVLKALAASDKTEISHVLDVKVKN